MRLYNRAERILKVYSETAVDNQAVGKHLPEKTRIQRRQPRMQVFPALAGKVKLWPRNGQNTVLKAGAARHQALFHVLDGPRNRCPESKAGILA